MLVVCFHYCFVMIRHRLDGTYVERKNEIQRQFMEKRVLEQRLPNWRSVSGRKN